MGRVSRKPAANLPKRRSSRLKGISSIYESISSNAQISENKSYSGCSNLTVEISFEGDQTCLRSGSDVDNDVEDVECIMLKDLRTKCKNKKHKFMERVTYPEDDGTGTDLHMISKVKEEEPDLDEPLCALKSKRSKNSKTQRKRMKIEYPSSDSSFPSKCLISDGIPIDEFSEEAERVSERSACESVSCSPSLEVEPKRETSNADSLQSILTVKDELVETDVWAYGNNAALHVSPVFIAKGDFADDSSDLHLNGKSESEEFTRMSNIFEASTCNLVEAVNFYGTLSMYKSGRNINVDAPKVTYFGENLECNALLHKSTVHKGISTSMDLIEKQNYHVTSPSNSEADDGANQENKQLNYYVGETLHCHQNEVSTEYRETEGTAYIPENSSDFEDNFSHLEAPTYLNSNLSAPCMHYNGSTDTCRMKDVNNLMEEIADDNIVNPVNHSAFGSSCNSSDPTNSSRLFGSTMMYNDTRDISSILANTEPLKTNASNVTTHLDPKETNELGPGDLENYDTGKTFGQEISHAQGCFELQRHDDCFSWQSHVTVSTLDAAEPTSNILCEMQKAAEMHQMSNASVYECNLTNMETLRESHDIHSTQVCSLGNLEALASNNLSKSEKQHSCPPSVGYLGYDSKQPQGTSSLPYLVEVEGNDDAKELKLDGEDLKEESPPRKLLSKRKSISPTSQEKLCLALNDMDLYDAMQNSKNKKKPLFQKSCEKEITSSITVDSPTGMTIGSDSLMKGPKNVKNGSLHVVGKGILKSSDATSRSPDTSSRKHCSCMKMSLMCKQTEDAITFSQRQMSDFETIALKLLKGLKSLKNIVEESLHSEPTLPGPPHHSIDKIKEAVSSASELETTTKRWLSILTRDCTRVCKIMRTRELEAASIENVVPRESKKILFADEAGAPLCQVKVFNDELCSVQDGISWNSEC